ncbi:hypothetical protein U1Q18_016141 [Sarracenia purpurea var. burkii]
MAAISSLCHLSSVPLSDADSLNSFSSPSGQNYRPSLRFSGISAPCLAGLLAIRPQISCQATAAISSPSYSLDGKGNCSYLRAFLDNSLTRFSDRSIPFSFLVSIWCFELNRTRIGGLRIGRKRYEQKAEFELKDLEVDMALVNKSEMAANVEANE